MSTEAEVESDRRYSNAIRRLHQLICEKIDPDCTIEVIRFGGMEVKIDAEELAELKEKAKKWDTVSRLIEEMPDYHEWLEQRSEKGRGKSSSAEASETGGSEKGR